jgi:hypothetical protein
MRDLLTQGQRRLIVAATLLTIAITPLAGCVLFDRHLRLTIPMVLTDDSDAVDVTTNPIEITDDVCNETLDCVEAYSTDQADYYRFTSRDMANEFESTLDVGFVVNYIVMDFSNKPDASKVDQRWAMEQLGGTWQDYEGTYPDL